jgi:DNA repair exonuclease SbcCD ATPase subunit
LNNQIANLESVIENANTQLDILNEQEQVLRDTRANDHAAFEERMQSTPKVIDALDVIASKLGAIQPESDADAVLAELRRIGSENPILALVQLASTFSAEKLQSVQDKIAELRASLEQSIVDDQEAETQQQIDFQALILQFAEQREALSAERSDAQRKLEVTQNQLASTFSAEKLQSVQDKIAELRASLEQSIVDDREAETQAQIDFEALILQFAEQRDALSAERSDAQRKLEVTNNQLASQKKRREDANRELMAATNGKTQKEAQCEGWRTAYAEGTEQRAEEVTIIRLIENILATKLEGARSYLQLRSA